MSACDPAEIAAVDAGRIMLAQIDACASRRESFAFETALSGRGYARYVLQWRSAGYQVNRWFLSPPSAEAAIARVQQRVTEGRHDVLKPSSVAGSTRAFETLKRSRTGNRQPGRLHFAATSANAMDWSRTEVDAVIRDYFSMLKAQLAGQRYSKAEHRRRLQRQLDGRSEQSIEFKHMNISAALMNMGSQYLRGYLPMRNVQRLLVEQVGEQLLADKDLATLAREDALRPAVSEPLLHFDKMLVDPPKREAPQARETAPEPEGLWDRCVQVDFLELEARNRSLGTAGEHLIVEFEQERLRRCGRPELGTKVEHSAQLRGDDAGFDVLSYDLDGSERYIEVKTTANGPLTPFWLSARELDFSRRNGPNFHLYRLFDFRRSPRLFELRGSVSEFCRLDPVSYRANLL